jgi:hypothetical protein
MYVSILFLAEGHEWGFPSAWRDVRKERGGADPEDDLIDRGVGERIQSDRIPL